MYKKIAVSGVVLVIVAAAGFLLFGNNAKEPTLEESVLRSTLDLSRDYVALRLATDAVLTEAADYPNFDAWNREMTRVITGWQELESASADLEKSADEYANSDIAFNLVTGAYAYDRKEITDIYDKAPAGKKIKTLAKFLGVDAKTAYQILQDDQTQAAKEWNKTGDNFEFLEKSAIVVKDGCKVTGFVGGIVLTGGTAGFAAAGVMSQTAVVVAGADLVLEVSDDAAYISLGNNNKVSEIVGNVRKVTEPAAAILAVADLPKNLVKGIEKLNAVMFGADQFRSAVQDGKVIGIKLPVYEKPKPGEEGQPDEIGMTVISPGDVDKWLEENGYERYDGDVDDIMAAWDEEDSKETGEENGSDEEDEAEADAGSDEHQAPDETGGVEPAASAGVEDASEANATAAGTWQGDVTYYDGSGIAHSSTLKLVLNSDGTCESASVDYEFFNWEKIGDVVRLYEQKTDKNNFFEFILSGDTMTFTRVVGLNSDNVMTEVRAGEDFFGGKFATVILHRQ